MGVDILAKKALMARGFTLGFLMSTAFLGGPALRVSVLAGQFWLMSQQPLGKVMSLLFVAGIITTTCSAHFA